MGQIFLNLYKNVIDIIFDLSIFPTKYTNYGCYNIILPWHPQMNSQPSYDNTFMTDHFCNIFCLLGLGKPVCLPWKTCGFYQLQDMFIEISVPSIFWEPGVNLYLSADMLCALISSLGLEQSQFRGLVQDCCKSITNRVRWTDRQMDGRLYWSVLRAAWSQLENLSIVGV